jgi:N utilization substance protein A
LVKYLVVNAISEVREEVIEIKDIARVPGFKTKIALVSHRPNLDPVGTLIGRRGERVKAIMEKINNEKIEGVRYTDDLNQYICNICLPVRLKGILVEKPRDQSESTNYVLIVSDEPVVNSFTQKSSTPSFMLLGKRGANTKIISQLLKGSVEVITEEEALDLDLNKKPEYVVVGDNYYNRSFDNNTSGSPYGNNDKTSRYKINYDEMDSLVKEQNKNRAYSQSKPVQNQEPASSSYEVKKHTKITFDDEDEE